MQHDEGKHLFAQGLDAQLYSVSLPILLQLCKVLNTLIGHPALVHFIFVVTDSPLHLKKMLVKASRKYTVSNTDLERIETLHGLNGRNKIREFGNR